MELKWDKEKNVVLVGNYEFKHYRPFRSRDWRYWADEVIRGNGIKLPLVYGKERNQAYADILKCRPTILFNHFRKLQYKALVAPYLDVLMKVGYSRGRIDTKMLYFVRSNYEVSKTTYDDGLYNILPLVVVTGKSPQELSKTIKNKWKVLANNSLNKNKVIAKVYITAIRHGHMYHLEALAHCASIAHLPTTLLHWHRKPLFSGGLPLLQYLTDNFRGSWGDRGKIIQAAMYYRDTKRLAEQLGRKFNPKWSARCMKEEHDRMTREINAKLYSPDVFECLKDVEPKSFSHQGYQATLLMSARDIADEGSAMGHCVGGYTSLVGNGHYLVYSVTKDGGRSSTIGLSRKKVRKWVSPEPGDVSPELGDAPYECKVVDTYEFNQHFGRFNELVTDEDEKQIPTLLLKLLNREDEAVSV